MNKSTSFHRVSADKTNLFYKIFARSVHTLFNIFNNLAPNKNVDSSLKYTFFCTDKLSNYYSKVPKNASPSRKLSDIFWMDLFAKKTFENFETLNICDIGCGSGNYFLKLNEYSNNKIRSYTGLDIYTHKNWEKLNQTHQNTNFKKYNGLAIEKLIPVNTNLIISQSAIEHFAEDLTIFQQLKTFSENVNHQVQQVHLFPSKVCLQLYPFHGVRQYTPRNISKITKLFPNYSCELIQLGGKESSKVHKKYITSHLLRKNNLKTNTDYNNACFEAIKIDMEKPLDIENANFYALIIKKK